MPVPAIPLLPPRESTVRCLLTVVYIHFKLQAFAKEWTGDAITSDYRRAESPYDHPEDA
jgi:hypothetical protein